MIKENYHTHMRLCTHAEGNIEDYIKSAIDHGFTDLGISDHGPLENSGFRRMSLDEFYNVYLPEYKECYKKYSKDIHLYLGLEIEYMYGNDSYYEELLKNVDYLILGNHYYSGFKQENHTSSYECNTIEKVREYVKLAVDAMSTGYFKIFAHPDIFLMGCPKWTEELEEEIRKIFLACIKYGVYLEFNCAGFDKGLRDFASFKDYGYPNSKFFTLAKEYKDLKIIISSDAHRPIDLIKNMDRGEEVLKNIGITPTRNPFR